jgi:carbon starvation protein CstA
MWPVMFITMSCGAISGFHSTQSPLMARTMTNEKYGRKVFYGAMITEGIIALIWATAGLSFYKSPDALLSVIDAGTPAKVVNDVSWSLLGHFGGLLAFIGVIVLPISTGDTAFRSNRLIFADIFRLSQSKIINRLIIAVPMFILGFVISKLDFQMLWRYFGWANQTLAMLVLWSASWFLARNKKNHWITTAPAVFMTAVSVSFILQSDLGFHLNKELSISIGILSSIIAFIFFLLKVGKFKSKLS